MEILPTEQKKEHGKRRQAAAGAENLAKWKRSMFAGAASDALRTRLDEFEASLIRDLGGAELLTAAKRALIASCRVSLGVISLAESLLLASSLSPSRTQALAGVLTVVAAHQNGLRRNLQALGIERAKPPVRTLAELSAEIVANRKPQPPKEDPSEPAA